MKASRSLLRAIPLLVMGKFRLRFRITRDIEGTKDYLCGD